MTLVPFADDGVPLPVANAAAFVHHGGALFDADAILQHASALLATGVALAVYLLAAQVARQITASSLVSVGVLVNALRTDGGRLFQLQPSTALLGREVQAQIGLDMAPLVGAEVARIAPLALA